MTTSRAAEAAYWEKFETEAQAQEWFKRHEAAIMAAPPGTLPVLTVTEDELAYIRDKGTPWTKLSDGREMWGGVVVVAS